MFGRLLDAVAAVMQDGHVILDAPLPESFVRRTRGRFGRDSLIVSLRIDEAEWRRRDGERRDRGRLVYWSPAVAALQGPVELFDLVIDTTTTSPQSGAEMILAKARSRWVEIERLT
jgi:hypothetical protein